MIAQAPNPPTATEIPTTEPTAYEAICRSSRLRKSISRVISAACVEVSDVRKKLIEKTAKRSPTSRLPEEVGDEKGQQRPRAR